MFRSAIDACSLSHISLGSTVSLRMVHLGRSTSNFISGWGISRLSQSSTRPRWWGCIRNSRVCTLGGGRVFTLSGGPIGFQPYKERVRICQLKNYRKLSNMQLLGLAPQGSHNNQNFLAGGHILWRDYQRRPCRQRVYSRPCPAPTAALMQDFASIEFRVDGLVCTHCSSGGLFCIQLGERGFRVPSFQIRGFGLHPFWGRGFMWHPFRGGEVGVHPFHGRWVSLHPVQD